MQLEIKDIFKNFGEKQVLTGVSFTANAGRAFGLLGRNGAGKTTLIRILMNVFPGNGVQILMDVKPIEYNSISFEQLLYFAELKGMDKKDATKSIGYWLDKLEMQEYRNKRLDTLSKGNQQKIQLITAIAHNPDIIILDEPFSGLDPVNAMLLKEVVKEQIKKGKIVLFSSHQMSYIEEFCDDIAIIHNGKVVLSGDLIDIKRNYPRNKLVVRSNDNEKIKELYNAINISELDILITLKSAEEKVRVIKDLAEKFDIDEIKVFEPSLNDIFVEYAGDKE